MSKHPFEKFIENNPISVADYGEALGVQDGTTEQYKKVVLLVLKDREKTWQAALAWSMEQIPIALQDFKQNKLKQKKA